MPTPTILDYDKLQSVLKQIVRDWSIEGEKERDACYGPIIEEVERRFGHLKYVSNYIIGYNYQTTTMYNQKDFFGNFFRKHNDIRVLIPGAGLGRLTHEIVKREYVVEGNDFSLFMLFASNFILNK